MADNNETSFLITRENFADPDTGLMAFFVESVHVCLRGGNTEELQALIDDMAEVAASIFDLLEEVQKAKVEYDRLIKELDEARQNSAEIAGTATDIENKLADIYGLKTTAELEAEAEAEREAEIQRRIEEEAQRIAEERIAEMMAQKARETGVVFYDEEEEEDDLEPDAVGDDAIEGDLGDFEFDDEFESAPDEEDSGEIDFDGSNISEPDVFAELSDDVFANVAPADDPFADVTDDPFSDFGMGDSGLPGGMVPFEPDVSDELKLEDDVESLTTEELTNSMLDIWAQNKAAAEKADEPAAPVFAERVPIQFGDQPGAAAPVAEPDSVPAPEPAHVAPEPDADIDMFIDDDLFDDVDELALSPDELLDEPAAAPEPKSDASSVFDDDDDFDDIPMGGMLA